MLDECVTVLWDWYFWCCARNQAEAYRAYDNDPTLSPTQRRVSVQPGDDDDAWTVL